MTTDLTDAGAVQGNLFDGVDRQRAGRLTAAMDAINDRLGGGTLRTAAPGIGRGREARHGHRTPRYTTRWDGLVTVRAGRIAS